MPESTPLFRKTIGHLKDFYVETQPLSSRADDHYQRGKKLGEEVVDLLTTCTNSDFKGKGFSHEYRANICPDQGNAERSRLEFELIVRWDEGRSLQLVNPLSPEEIVSRLEEKILVGMDAVANALQQCVALNMSHDSMNPPLPPICPVPPSKTAMPGSFTLDVASESIARCVKKLSDSSSAIKGFDLVVGVTKIQFPNCDFWADCDPVVLSEAAQVSLVIAEVMQTGNKLKLRQSKCADNTEVAFVVEVSGAEVPENLLAQIRKSKDGRLGPKRDAQIGLNDLVGLELDCEVYSFCDPVTLVSHRPKLSICAKVLAVKAACPGPTQDELFGFFG